MINVDKPKNVAMISMLLKVNRANLIHEIFPLLLFGFWMELIHENLYFLSAENIKSTNSKMIKWKNMK